ncbi:hypothetical protein QTP86_019415 [Hemibagrus guttatus]|nr:hypothetical protein QTP86_019415 [Hemibagrus guttatus]
MHAFQMLKQAFTTAPLLVHPDPEFPFIVEVDASTTGVGAVLSQQQGNPQKLHPCAFFSRKLNPAEVNYDIGNRELLAIKLTLEEWRHWLEGAKHPFTVLTDHKNLEYLRAAKRLNPHQARWALFFTRFKFAISYRPGSKNVKANALSRIYGPDIASDDPEPILPEKIFASPISWSEDTFPESDAPPGCPPGLQFVPRQIFQGVLANAPAGTTYSPGNGRMPFQPRLQVLWAPRGHCLGPGTTVHFQSLESLLQTPRCDHQSFLGLPPPNGQTERKIQEIGRFLRTFCHSHQGSWSQFLGWAEYGQNSLRQSTTGLTPFQCVLGYQPPLFPWDGEPSDIPAVDYWFRESERVWGEAHRQLQRALRRRRTTADLRRSQTPAYQPNETQ